MLAVIEAIFMCDELASRTSPLSQNLDKNINSFHIQNIHFCQRISKDLQKNSQKIPPKIPKEFPKNSQDSGFVKTCDELFIGHANRIAIVRRNGGFITSKNTKNATRIVVIILIGDFSSLFFRLNFSVKLHA